MGSDYLVGTNEPPFEAADLRACLKDFLASPFKDSVTGNDRAVGDYQWGVYAFYDYDGEPIYVGQTNEKLRTRIRRHLTNQRTDAVAMSVLDPFEVFEIEVWPLASFQGATSGDKVARNTLDALEHAVYARSVQRSAFKAILNEKNSPEPQIDLDLNSIRSFRASVVSTRVRSLRSHPDYRIARRALVMARLAQVIAERKVQVGLRRVLLTQAKRLEWLAKERFGAMGGEAAVPEEGDDES